MNALYLSGNKVTNVTALSGMSKLSSLYLDGNQVTDLHPLSELRWLSSLDLRGNLVKDLAPLARLSELKYLTLDQNKITDIAPLVAMARKDAEGEKRFAPYWTVSLKGNPLNAASRGASMTELKKYSHTVQAQ